MIRSNRPSRTQVAFGDFVIGVRQARFAQMTLRIGRESLAQHCLGDGRRIHGGSS
jgi:hypothetical protein